MHSTCLQGAAKFISFKTSFESRPTGCFMTGLCFKMKKSNTSGSWVTREEKEHASESNSGNPDLNLKQNSSDYYK